MPNTSTDRLPPRRDLDEIVRAALDVVDAGRLTESALADPGIAELASRAVLLVAAGKVAAHMAASAARHLSRLRGGLVTAPPGPPDDGALERFTAGHPFPNEQSVAAGTRALELGRSIGPQEALIVLLSGGASAMLAAPVQGLSLSDKAEATRQLLDAGADIHALNAVRKHLSRVKGGQLAAAAHGATLTLALSDVVGPIEDDPSVIASGPTVGDPTTYEDAFAVIARLKLRRTLPSRVLEILERGARGALVETPKPGDRRLQGSILKIAGSRRDAMAGAARCAERLGYHVTVLAPAITGEARDAGRNHAHTILDLAADMPRPACVISSGETTVRVVGQGRGGRNQEFALAFADADPQCGGLIALASVGTDGVDGRSGAAGAIADSSTLTRAASAGLASPRRHLDHNDSTAYFEPLGDLIVTGPTRTNVGDLQVVVLL